MSIIGGGGQIRPGEISLAHRGVLLFDELPEFDRATLEALRQPLEDRTITIARAKDVLEFPANFILVATANPCPCGYYGYDLLAKSNRCRCTNSQIRNYRNRLSGPIMDRIDLFGDVSVVDHAHLLQKVGKINQKLLPMVVKPRTNKNDVTEVTISAQVQRARQMQAARFGDVITLNASMSNADIRRHANLDRLGKLRLNESATRQGLSARAYMRTLKVARTIADIEASDIVTAEHIEEALHYRRRPELA